jgi:hypothetical protein
MRNRMIVSSLVGAAVVLGGLATVGVVSASGDATNGLTTRAIDPANFDNPKPNPYFPLRPGTVFVLRGTEDEDRLLEHVRVTHRTKTIEGVETIVVRDVVLANGRLAERTFDWYAPDDLGNVWYFGEDTATYDAQGHVESREGSWEAGVHGAVAGIIMPADPKPTDAYRQELWRGHAEDQAWIVQAHARLRLPVGRLDHVVRTFEWTRLEPRVVSSKYYAPHLGIVREHDVAGGSEDITLVRVIRP